MLLLAVWLWFVGFVPGLLLSVVRRMLSDVCCCLLFVKCGLLSVVRLFLVFAACCLLVVVCFSLLYIVFFVCCSLTAKALGFPLGKKAVEIGSKLF